MFTHHCTACDRRQLNFASQVLGLENSEHGIVMTFRCWCGAEQKMLTGLDARAPRAHVAA